MTKATRDRFWTAARDNPSLAEVRSWKEQAIQLAREPAVNFYDLADILLNLRECDSALLYDVADQAKISRRKVYYLLAAGQLIADWAITRAEAESVGWTKLQIIARHVALEKHDTTRARLDSYLKLARSTKARSLGEALETGVAEPRTAVVFHLTIGLVWRLNDALLAFGAKQDHRGFRDKEAAFARILAAAMKDHGQV